MKKDPTPVDPYAEPKADPNVAGLDNTCTTSLTTCNPANDFFGQILNSRAPREIQLGFKFYW